MQDGSSVRRLVAYYQLLVRQLAKFGTVGLAALVVDVGLFNLLRFAGGEGPLYEWVIAAKVLSSVAATVVSWLGNRYWTFRHTRRSAAHREFLLFIVMCSIGLGISLACLGLSHYVLGLTSPLADNVAANVVGLGLGTAFRFWAYRTFVFTSDREERGQTTEQGAPAAAAVGQVR